LPGNKLKETEPLSSSTIIGTTSLVVVFFTTGCAFRHTDRCAADRLSSSQTPAPTDPGEKAQKEAIFITPETVVERLSTEVLAIDDPQTLQAIQYLQAHACENIKLDDILRKVPMDRRALERKFKSLLGRPPAKEICRYKIGKPL
jgi:transcriptional regulator GlxA family with amidase domain